MPRQLVTGSEAATGKPDRSSPANMDEWAGVEQAKGALAGIFGIEPAAAFDLLRRHARDGKVEVPVLAAALIQRLSGSSQADRVAGPALEDLLADVTGHLAEWLRDPPEPPTGTAPRPDPPGAQHLWDAVCAARSHYDPRVLGHAENVVAQLYRPLARDLSMENRRAEVSLPATFRAALNGLDHAVRAWRQPEIDGFATFAADQIAVEIGRLHDHAIE